MPDLILAIDQGTTGTTVMAVDAGLNVLARQNREFPQHYPRAGWVEHDLEDIWEATLGTIHDLVGTGAIDPARIAAIGITNQRETVGLWEKATGRPAQRAIVWQDRRTAGLCRQLQEAGREEWLAERTGLLIDPYFSATKLQWLFDEIPDLYTRARDGELAIGTIDSFLVWRLTGGAEHVTDVTNASRTQLMNLATLQWDDELLALFHVPRSALPAIRPSSQVYGTTTGVPGLPDGIPIAGIAGDQQAALFGQACFEPGTAKCTYGTGAFVLVNTGDHPVRSRHRLLTTVGWQVGDQVAYALEGSVFIAGAAVQWLRDGLGLIATAAEVEDLARTVDASGDVVFVPALAGLGAPHWRPEARGMVAGITRDTHRGHLARATLEGIAFQVNDVLQAMAADLGSPLRRLKVDGGACVNDLLMQFQADLLGRELVRPAMVETTALGAAFLAGLATGVWGSPAEIESAWRCDRCFHRTMEEEVVAGHLAKWRRAVERAAY